MIGKIFSGEKGGGLIAPTYTIKGKLPAPDISVNAFSALAPGAIRSLFGKLSNNDQDMSRTEPQKSTAPSPPAKQYKPLDPSQETEFTDVLHHEPAGR